MNWYNHYKIICAGQNGFTGNIIGTLGVAAMITLLMTTLNIPKQTAENMLKTQPEKAQQIISQLPPNIVEQAKSAPQQNPSSQQSAANSIVSVNDVIGMITQHEGKKNKVYMDTTGNPTIGVGFNLNRKDASQLLKQIGANYNSIINGQESLSDQQINKLLSITIQESIGLSQQFIPDLFSHPLEVQKVIVDMMFNLGPNKFNNFHKFKQAIESKDYRRAAQEMQNSKWFKQVGTRGQELSNIMNTAK